MVILLLFICMYWLNIVVGFLNNNISLWHFSGRIKVKMSPIRKLASTYIVIRSYICPLYPIWDYSKRVRDVLSVGVIRRSKDAGGQENN